MKQKLFHDGDILTPVQGGLSLSHGKRVAKEVLLLCTTSGISQARKEQISRTLAGTIDWKYLLELARLHEVLPLISYNILNNDFTDHVPEPYKEQMEKIYYSTLFRNVLLSSELANVLSRFSQNGIAVISLKGTVLAEMLYGNPGMRTTSDTDIIVQPEVLSRARSLLLEMGYTQSKSPEPWEHPFHEEPYRKQSIFPMSIELHWDLDDSRFVSVSKEEIWRRARPLHLQWGSPVVLSPEDTLLFLSIQLIDHCIPLKLLGDITELLKKYQDALDWDYILKSAYSWGVNTVLYCALRKAKDLLEAPVSTLSLNTLKPGAWRWRLVNFLINDKIIISPMKKSKLRDKTFSVARSLMMKHFFRTLSILTRTHSLRKNPVKGTRVWITPLIVLVFSTALVRNVARFVSG